jgi:hypothetical protein
VRGIAVDWATIIPVALTGFASGTVASLTAPWAQWGIKKRELRMEARRKLVSDIRFLASEATDRNAFKRTPAYFQIRPYLTIKMIEQTEKPSNEVAVTFGDPSPTNHFWKNFLKELSCLETDWKLI